MTERGALVGEGHGEDESKTLAVPVSRRGALALAAAVIVAGWDDGDAVAGRRGRRGKRRRKERGGDSPNAGPEPGPGFGDGDGAVALGAFVPGAPDDPARLDAFAERVGRMPAIVAWYQHWGGAAAAFDPALPRRVADRGATPLVTWEPWDPRRGVDQLDYRLAAIARGDFDDYARSWAAGLAAFGGPVLLRFAHEMNGTWYPWCVGVNGNEGADYVAAWTRLRRIFAEEGADNVRWVWSPNVDYRGASPLAATFPGDAMVDWVALDGYNWGTSRAGTDWRSFAAVFGDSCDALRAISSRPVMLAETACAEQGGDKGSWIADGLRRELPHRFPAVRAVVWFGEEKEADWRVNSSPGALAAYRAAVADPYLRGALP